MNLAPACPIFFHAIAHRCEFGKEIASCGQENKI
jgi:hypothetical protein